MDLVTYEELLEFCAVKVVVFLTMPVDTLSDGLSEQMEYVCNFKASFLSNDAIAVIVTLLEEPLEHLER